MAYARWGASHREKEPHAGLGKDPGGCRQVFPPFPRGEEELEQILYPAEK